MKKSSILFAIAIFLVFMVSCVSREYLVTETYTETEYRMETYTETEDVVTDTILGEDVLKPEMQWDASHIVSQTELSPPLLSSDEKVWYFGYKIPQHDTSKVQVIPSQYHFEEIFVYDLGEQAHIQPPPPGRWVCTGTSSSRYGIGSTYKWSDLYPWQHTLEDWITSTNLTLKTATQLEVWYPEMIWESEGWSLGYPEFLEVDVTGIKNLAIITSTLITPISRRENPIKTVKLMWSDKVVEKRTVTKERQVPYEVERQRTVMETEKVPFWEAILGK
jgi:hypothetical protein